MVSSLTGPGGQPAAPATAEPSPPGVLSSSLAARTLVTLVGLPTRWALALLAALLATAWSLIHLGGGAGVVVPHTYYLPVLLAAIRFGWRGSLAVASIAGILAGPLTYQLVASQQPQTVSEWVTRTVAFLLVGQLVAWLFRHALASVQRDAQLARADAELARALERGELSLRYQPIIDTADGTLIGLEALVRWDHVDGERGPCSFIPTAEHTGRIAEVGRFVLRAAVEQAARWHRDAVAAGRHAPTVGINVAAQDLATDRFVEEVRAALRTSGLPAEHLAVEVTEGALIHDLEGSARRLTALRDLGVRIVVDDFGTGYSSLAYVHRFPLDVLKVDRAFVMDIEDNDAARELVGGILALCQRLGMTVVAEGVETAGQLELLRAFGCPLVQGYHLASPARAEELGEWLVRTPRVTTPVPLSPEWMLADRLAADLPVSGWTPPDGTWVPGRPD